MLYSKPARASWNAPVHTDIVTSVPALTAASHARDSGELRGRRRIQCRTLYMASLTAALLEPRAKVEIEATAVI
ncbi:MAG TPA: hypothetical protein VML92_00650 [Steroidobacteraceae bacterium]|nr:hypothetical protein [Steroidobacteraceae bacterium]